MFLTTQLRFILYGIELVVDKYPIARACGLDIDDYFYFFINGVKISVMAYTQRNRFLISTFCKRFCEHIFPIDCKYTFPIDCKYTFPMDFWYNFPIDCKTLFRLIISTLFRLIAVQI